jgi:hypothetical protein
MNKFINITDLIERNESLEKRLENCNNKISDVLATLYDYDGYYDPVTKTGNVEKLAMIIDEAYDTLKGVSRNSEKEHEPLPDDSVDIEE